MNYNFEENESILKYLINPHNKEFSYTKQEIFQKKETEI